MAIDKSKYKSVGSIMTDRSWPEKGGSYTVGEGVEGIYIAKNEKVGVNVANVYIIQTETEKVGVWGSTVLDARFEAIPVGSKVAIEYIGAKKPKSGGKAYHDFFVGIDEGFEPTEPATVIDDEIPF